MENYDNSAYDIYLLQSSGLPLLAGCTGSDYCKKHGDQHDLHTGFISALNSFSQEVFTDTPKTILYDQIQINIKSMFDITIVTVHPIKVKTSEINNQLDFILSKFHEKYGEISKMPDVEIFEEFRPIIDSIGMSTGTIMNTIPLQQENGSNQPSLRKSKRKTKKRRFFKEK
jgi:hypothetical protein